MSYELSQRTSRKLSPGRPDPQGATLEAGGVNFALYSQTASEVWLLLFDSERGDPTDVVKVENQHRYVWHVFVHGVQAGQLYAFKVGGDFAPERGLRFNRAKLLMDPYAKALTGDFHNQDNLLLAYDPADPRKDLSFDPRDNAGAVPKCVVIDDHFDWRRDRHPGIPLEKLFIYEVHLKGFTAHPSSGVKNPGTYLGFIEKIPYLTKLGINAVEFLPLHEFYVEDFLLARGLTNYWGYNSVAFFAPESSYASSRAPGAAVGEFKTLVRELHRAGIEVILDVVYNHTGEGSELGPTICFRGIDNPTYYALDGGPGEPGRSYKNYTGCGNSMNMAHPQVVRLVMDSLRYWVSVMHVDGFRFDLASVLGRGEDGTYRKSGAFFEAVSQDPVLSRAKLIAEPWDVGTYQVGNFPVDWSEWNGRFRDCVRRFGRGDRGQVRELGWRVTGSADLYGDGGRSASNSVNFITCHDGFTLHDLLAYGSKHNEANKEDNKDGADHNDSSNGGVEGETSDPAVLALRRRLAKNCVCHLFFSCGTPMTLGGDEFLRTQKGNNNAYCQDNELSWFDWRLAKQNADFLEFFRKAIALTKQYPILQRRSFLKDEDTDKDGVPDIRWFGKDLGAPAWDDPECRSLAYLLDGLEPAADGKDYHLFFILNAADESLWQKLPPVSNGKRWRRVVDTSLPAGQDFMDLGREVVIDPPGVYIANGRSTVVLVAK